MNEDTTLTEQEHLEWLSREAASWEQRWDELLERLNEDRDNVELQGKVQEADKTRCFWITERNKVINGIAERQALDVLTKPHIVDGA